MSTKLLILGGGGMLGHKVWQTARETFRTFATVRGSPSSMVQFGFAPDETIGGVQAGDFDSVVRAFQVARPLVVINCIGIIKQLPEAHDPIVSIGINSLFPHRVHALCRAAGAHLIHVSTDCVFSGRKGGYIESDIPDAEDLYGRSKLLGETSGDGALTLRTSIIGRELAGSNGLVEWFLSRRGQTVEGFPRAIFSGLTTAALAGVILDVARREPPLSGLYHVSADPISKYDLLQLMNDEWKADVTVTPSERVVIDRSLDSSRFRAAMEWHPPVWSDLVRTMVADAGQYDSWRTR